MMLILNLAPQMDGVFIPEMVSSTDTTTTSHTPNPVHRLNWQHGPSKGFFQEIMKWQSHGRRVTSTGQVMLPFKVYDGTNLVFEAEVNQQVEPTADYVEEGKPFQKVFASVNVSTGTLVVKLSNEANDYVVADAVRIKSLDPAGPDVSAPTADLSNPQDGSTIDSAVLNAQGYIEVSYVDSGDGIDEATILDPDNELSLSGDGVNDVVLNGTPTLVDGSYQYGFTGSFIDGDVVVTFVAESFADLADTPNLNIQEIESFTLADSPPATAQLIDDGDDGFSIAEGWRIYQGNYLISGYNTSFTSPSPPAPYYCSPASWASASTVAGLNRACAS